jgi:hypothetical protein
MVTAAGAAGNRGTGVLTADNTDFRGWGWGMANPKAEIRNKSRFREFLNGALRLMLFLSGSLQADQFAKIDPVGREVTVKFD